MTAQDLPTDLRRALTEVARTPRLLIASDYDGTMAPIVADPAKAFPNDDSTQALQALASLRDTTAAVISGRARSDLSALSGLSDEVQLVGSHGSEFAAGFVHAMDDNAKQLLDDVTTELTGIAAQSEGVTIETKPASVALHVRNAPEEVGREALARVRHGAATWAGVQVTEGKAVIELAVISTDKGDALDMLRQESSASAAVFIGDDVTDEKAFRRLDGADVGVKVGDGATAAQYRVGSTDDVATVLGVLHDERREWLDAGN